MTTFQPCTMADFPREERPPCPRCGSTNIQSKGIEWKCRDCSRTWNKAAKRCPHCGEVVR
ncbi:MAG: hypothetical protein ABFD82_03820 [Syntrophaceae bacterium]